MNKSLTVMLGMACLVGVSSAARAQTLDAPMGVSMVVAAECTITSTAMAFTGTGLIDANIVATADLTVQCTPGTPYAIALSNGGGAGATDTLRQMTSGTNTVDYMIYQDAANTLPWSPTATLVSPAATGGNEIITAYGTVPTGQIVPTGTYADSVVATITY